MNNEQRNKRGIYLEIISCKKRKYTYVLLKNKKTTEDIDNVTIYGIAIIGKNRNAVAKDISDDFCFVHYLFDLIVEEELYPDHLFDVVEDFLIEYDPKKFPISKAHKYPYIA